MKTLGDLIREGFSVVSEKIEVKDGEYTAGSYMEVKTSNRGHFLYIPRTGQVIEMTVEYVPSLQAIREGDGYYGN